MKKLKELEQLEKKQKVLLKQLEKEKTDKMKLIKDQQNKINKVTKDIQQLKPLKNLKGKNKTFSIENMKRWFKENFIKSTVIINMELLNGDHRTFLVKTSHEGFTYKKGVYIFDSDAQYYNRDLKSWCFDYHEGFNMPFKRKFPLNQTLDTIEAANIAEIEYAVNPQTLERFMTSKMAEGIMKGQEISEFLDKMYKILVILSVIAGIHLLLFIFKTGMLSSVGINI